MEFCSPKSGSSGQTQELAPPGHKVAAERAPEDVCHLTRQRVELSRYGAAALACNSDFGSTEIFVERVHEHKHLGIYLNTSLCWARQIHETCLRAKRKLAVLRSVRFLKRSTLDLLYKVCVRSTIEYGLVIYWHTLKPSEAARIKQIQYHAAKRL